MSTITFDITGEALLDIGAMHMMNLLTGLYPIDPRGTGVADALAATLDAMDLPEIDEAVTYQVTLTADQLESLAQGLLDSRHVWEFEAKGIPGFIKSSRETILAHLKEGDDV